MSEGAQRCCSWATAVYWRCPGYKESFLTCSHAVAGAGEAVGVLHSLCSGGRRQRQRGGQQQHAAQWLKTHPTLCSFTPRLQCWLAHTAVCCYHLRRALYHCNYCHRDISDNIRIKCAVCADFDLCVECFSVGVEVNGHINTHSYKVMDNLSFPIFHPNWGVSRTWGVIAVSCWWHMGGSSAGILQHHPVTPLTGLGSCLEVGCAVP
jgi:hypothetical protein